MAGDVTRFDGNVIFDQVTGKTPPPSIRDFRSVFLCRNHGLSRSLLKSQALCLAVHATLIRVEFGSNS